MHEKDTSANKDEMDWLDQQLRQAVKDIAPQRSFDLLHQDFIERFKKPRARDRWRKRLGIGTGLGAAIGAAADTLFGIEWLEIIEALFLWLAKSSGLATSIMTTW